MKKKHTHKVDWKKTQRTRETEPRKKLKVAAVLRLDITCSCLELKVCLLFVCHATMRVQAKIDIEVQDSLKPVLEKAKRNHLRLKFTFSKKRNSTHFNLAFWLKLLISEINYLKFVNISLFTDCAYCMSSFGREAKRRAKLNILTRVF